MRRITPNDQHALHDVAATRAVEQSAAATLAPHTLMRRAGLAIAQLAQAIHPHACTIWVACGPGNNGGDGIEADIPINLLAETRGYGYGKTNTGAASLAFGLSELENQVHLN